MEGEKILFLILLLEIQLQMLQLCFSAHSWASIEAKLQILLCFVGKVIHSSFHCTAPEFSPQQVLQWYSGSLMHVLTHLTKTNMICSMSPITNHYSIKNISAMSWGHNARLSGGLEFFISFIALSKVLAFLLAEIYLLVLSD